MSRLARERRDKAIISSFSEASSLHKNFYENELSREVVELSREVVEKMAENVEQLIARLKNLSLKKKALPTTFLPSVKTLTKLY